MQAGVAVSPGGSSSEAFKEQIGRRAGKQYMAYGRKAKLGLVNTTFYAQLPGALWVFFVGIFLRTTSGKTPNCNVSWMKTTTVLISAEGPAISHKFIEPVNLKSVIQRNILICAIRVFHSPLSGYVLTLSPSTTLSTD